MSNFDSMLKWRFGSFFLIVLRSECGMARFTLCTSMFAGQAEPFLMEKAKGLPLRQRMSRHKEGYCFE